MLAVPEWMGQEHVIFGTCGYHLWPLCSLLMAIRGLKGRGCLFKRILSCLDCIFFIKNVYTFSFFSPQFCFLLLGKFLQKKRNAFHLQRAYVDSHVTSRATLSDVLKFLLETMPSYLCTLFVTAPCCRRGSDSCLPCLETCLWALLFAIWKLLLHKCTT